MIELPIVFQYSYMVNLLLHNALKQHGKLLNFLIYFSVYDITFKPDGSQVVIAAGKRVLVRLSCLLWSRRHIAYILQKV